MQVASAALGAPGAPVSGLHFRHC
eukprot:SAG31_NODE_37178_length_306_cov_1.178744_1_plen_23_part_10